MRKPLLTPAQARRMAQDINEQGRGYRSSNPKMLITVACRALERKRDDDLEKAMTREVWE